MNSTNKKSPGARGTPQPFNRQVGHMPQHKPVVAQLKSAVSAQSVKQPVAPPVYRPQAKPNAVQPKTASPSQIKTQPVAPLVYRPQPTPKVLQTKCASGQQAHAGQSLRQPVAPPVYCPQTPSKAVQAKIAQGRPPVIQPKVKAARLAAPPVYRPQNGLKAVQPKKDSASQLKTVPVAPPVYRPQPAPKVLQTKRAQDKTQTPAHHKTIIRVPRPSIIQAVWGIDPDKPGYYSDPDLQLRYDPAEDRFYRFDGSRRVLTKGQSPRNEYMAEIARVERFRARASGSRDIREDLLMRVDVGEMERAERFKIRISGSRVICEDQLMHVDAAEFRVEQRHDSQGGSLYLTHMQTETKYQGKGLGRQLLKAALSHFKFFRIGTEPNVEFFKPTDPKDEIPLTREGEQFIDKMMAESILTHAHVFPMDYQKEYGAMRQQAQSSSSDNESHSSSSDNDKMGLKGKEEKVDKK